MGYAELMNWQNAFLDVDCIRIMFYLAKYNPNRQFSEMQNRLELNEKKLSHKINKLLEANLLNINEHGEFTLKEKALIGLNNFIELTKTNTTKALENL